MEQPKTADEASQSVAHVLNTVDIPIGVAQSRLPDGSLISDYTQWVSIKDLTHNRLMIADYNHRLDYLSISTSIRSSRVTIPSATARQRVALSQAGQRRRRARAVRRRSAESRFPARRLGEKSARLVGKRF